MNINTITLDEGMYEVRRVFAGKKQLSELIIEGLNSSKTHLIPLTNEVESEYNKNGEDRG